MQMNETNGGGQNSLERSRRLRRVRDEICGELRFHEAFRKCARDISETR